MSSPQALGYFTPSLPPVQGGAVTSLPTIPGTTTTTTTVQSWDTWVPTSSADPYVAGMRTSGSAMAALTGASKAATNVSWNAMVKARSGAGLAKMNNTLRAASRSTAAKQTYMAGKSFGAAKAAVKSPGIGAAFSGTFLSISNIARAMGGAAIIAVPISLITNFLDFQAGKINAQQRNSLIVADIGGYTVTGATSTLIGGFVGSTFLGPVVGTAAGVAAGFALGWVYEKFIRPQWGQMVHNAMYSTTVTTTPTTPTTPYPLPK